MKPLSNRAQQVLAKVGRIDYAAYNAADKILRVRGCGRKTLKEIAAAFAQRGVKLGGLEQTVRGYSSVPTMTTASVQPAEFVRVAKLVGIVPKRQRDGSNWWRT